MTAAHEVWRGGSPPDDLSEEALYWGCKRVDGNWKSGTRFGSATQALRRWGQPLETSWPYDPSRSEGIAYSPPAPPGDSWFSSALRRLAAEPDDVRTALGNGSPVLLGLILYRTFLLPDASGHITDPPAAASPRGRHAVVAVGYQQGEVLIRNSWGTSWALGGYAWIRDSYIAAHAREAWVIDPTAGREAPQAGASVGEGESYGTR